MASRALLVLGIVMVTLLFISSEVTARELAEETTDAVKDQGGGCQYGCCGGWYQGRCQRCCTPCQYGCCGGWYQGRCQQCCSPCKYGCCGGWYQGRCKECCSHKGGNN